VTIRRRAGLVARRAVVRAAGRFGLETFAPAVGYREHLDELAEYVEDDREVRDKRPTTLDGEGRDLTLTLEGLEDVLGGERWRGASILEVGPKYGIHSRWLDRELAPSELVFCDFPSDRPLHERWQGELTGPHTWVYADLLTARELQALQPFDLVLFLGVLYHSVYHLQLLAALNRVTRAGGSMLLETTFDPRCDASVRLRWQEGTAKAKAVPTIDALRVLLAWAGWRRVRRFTDYRPDSTEALFLCEKTDELVEGSDFAPIVRPHRPASGTIDGTLMA
jgi:SAM-dependent methyltransferase